MGDDKRTMNDGVGLQLTFKPNSISDGDRAFCLELQPLFRQVQDIAKDGVAGFFQEGEALYREAEVPALLSHDSSLQ